MFKCQRNVQVYNNTHTTPLATVFSDQISSHVFSFQQHEYSHLKNPTKNATTISATHALIFNILVVNLLSFKNSFFPSSVSSCMLSSPESSGIPHIRSTHFFHFPTSSPGLSSSSSGRFWGVFEEGLYFMLSSNSISVKLSSDFFLVSFPTVKQMGV